MNKQDIKNQIEKACKRLAPAWPLKNSVAVNPYLGLSEISFNESAKLLSERANIKLTMPIVFYLNSIDNGQITPADLTQALERNNKEVNVGNFIERINSLADKGTPEKKFRTKTIVDLVETRTNKNWNHLMVDKISDWASSYFDQSGVSWNTTDSDTGLFKAWKEDAQIDLSTEIMGIKNFRSNLRQLPNDQFEATTQIIQSLNLSEDKLEAYLHTLLLKVLGWSSFAAGEDWNNNLYGTKTNNLSDFLSILLCWEFCFLKAFEEKGIASLWANYKAELDYRKDIHFEDEELETQIILQNAYDLACERQLTEKFNANETISDSNKKARIQAVFCIDVRSEVYRRNLEKCHNEIETIGFAGFFGFPINYVPLAHQEGKNQCPVLIPSGPVVKERFKENLQAKQLRVKNHQFNKTWSTFKSGAVSSFGFVSPLGLLFLPKILSDSFGVTRPTKDPNVDGLKKYIQKGRELDLSEITLKDKVAMATSAITAMGLKDNMASLILIAGHGSSSVNNPHASGLDCGACGGHSGEINAMTAAQILNDVEVRKGLVEKGIEIPEDTHFLAAKHDTSTDEVHLINEESVPTYSSKSLMILKRALKQSSNESRIERSKRFNIKKKDKIKSLLNRSKDWSQTRPEWGLAGCNSFIVAPRFRTAQINLEGKSFLHSYDWKKDQEFKILESIITAPMIVTSWINLQYFASTTDNERLGSGNKTLHHVTAGAGVLEGAAGDLRIGLPLQSIHDGKVFQHLPQRLNVIIEAPEEAITSILRKHPSVKELCDNSWITLLRMDSKGKVCSRYNKNYKWDQENPEIIEKEYLTTI